MTNAIRLSIRGTVCLKNDYFFDYICTGAHAFFPFSSFSQGSTDKRKCLLIWFTAVFRPGAFRVPDLLCDIDWRGELGMAKPPKEHRFSATEILAIAR